MAPKQSAGGRTSGGKRAFALLVALTLVVALAAWGLSTLLEKTNLFLFDTPGSGEINAAENGEVTGPVPTTPPLDFRGFDPGYILTDEVMLNWQSMDQQQIEEFIATAGKGCRPGKNKDGKVIPCLSHFRTDTGTHVADRYCPRNFIGAKNDSAAAIIYKAAYACGINPQVLLVTLQKEQGLLTAWGQGLSATRYRSAMGYACPDGAACDPNVAGFENQVYHAARQFQRYRLDPDHPHYAFKAGRTSDVRTGPNEKCAKRSITMQNWATAALYNYTPYVPASDNIDLDANGPCHTPANAMVYAYMKAYFNSAP